MLKNCPLEGGGDHGWHGLVADPEGKSIYVVAGNATRLRKPEQSRVREVLDRARELKGLSDTDVLTLLATRDPELLQECFDAARWAEGLAGR